MSESTEMTTPPAGSNGSAGADATAGDASVHPDHLMRDFSRSGMSFGRLVVMAVVVHLAVGLLTSVPYLLDMASQTFDPEGYAARQAAAEAAALEAARPAPIVVTPATDSATSNANANANGDDAGGPPRAATEIERALNDAAPASEIPTDPELGISLDDLN